MVQTKYDNIFVDKTDVYRKEKSGEYKKICKWIDCLGYYMVQFRVNGKKKYVRVHRLIAETLLPNPNNYPQVNHIDGNKLNNQLSNLEWCTNSQNTKHGYDNNLYHSTHRSHAIVATDKTTGEKFIYSSIRSCAESLHLNRKTITSILKDNKTNNYSYEFQYLESVSTIPDECKGVGLEISTKPERKAAS